MDSGIFITDNRLKFSQELANKLRDKGLKVCLSSEYKEDNKESGVTTEIEWNRSSLFSLQAIPLKLKNINIAATTINNATAIELIIISFLLFLFDEILFVVVLYGTLF